MLQAFCAVIDAKSFRLAAERTGRSQPALSQAVAALEKEAGYTLLERRGRRPTPAGQLLYDRARRILDSVTGLQQELEDFDEGRGGVLRIGSSDTMALYVLPHAVKAFAARLPQKALTLVHRSSDVVAEQVLSGELDAGIVTLPAQAAGLESGPLFEQRIVLAAPRGHPMAGRKRARLADVEGEPLLMLAANTRTGAALRRYFRDRRFEPRAVLDSGSFEVIKRHVAAGVGLGFLPEMTVAADEPGVAAVALEAAPSVSIGAVWREGAYQSKAMRTFFEVVRANAPGR
jgi:DNA-binding transcriptional LysR family regulator